MGVVLGHSRICLRVRRLVGATGCIERLGGTLVRRSKKKLCQATRTIFIFAPLEKAAVSPLGADETFVGTTFVALRGLFCTVHAPVLYLLLGSRRPSLTKRVFCGARGSATLYSCCIDERALRVPRRRNGAQHRGSGIEATAEIILLGVRLPWAVHVHALRVALLQLEVLRAAQRDTVPQVRFVMIAEGCFYLFYVL